MQSSIALIIQSILNNERYQTSGNYRIDIVYTLLHALLTGKSAEYDASGTEEFIEGICLFFKRYRQIFINSIMHFVEKDPSFKHILLRHLLNLEDFQEKSNLFNLHLRYHQRISIYSWQYHLHPLWRDIVCPYPLCENIFEIVTG